MERINGMKEKEVFFSPSELQEVDDEYKAVSKKASIPVNELQIIKKYIDARHKDRVKIIYRVTRGKRPVKGITLDNTYNSSVRPVIIGFGPAGMFAGLYLSKAGLRPVILERGGSMEERISAVNNHRNGGELSETSNIQFGEGGAGTFSDGKLYSGIKKSELTEWVLEEFVKHGASQDILYDAHPHIGTDILQGVVVGIRKEIEKLGGEVRFNSKFTGIEVNDTSLKNIIYEDKDGEHKIDTSVAILAPGHSSRDTFRYLNAFGIPMESKQFSVGVRIEHKRSMIDKSQYGFDTGDTEFITAAPYKLAVDTSTGRKLYTFCMCPGGEVVAASSEKEGVVTNGMSYSGRDLPNSNSALLVPVYPSDFGEGILDGVRFQEELEHRAFIAGGSDGKAPCTLYKDFAEGRISQEIGEVVPSYKPGIRFAELRDVLPDYVIDTLIEGISNMGRKIKGFDSDDAVITAVESRSSSPVRILRDRDTNISLGIKGLIPCGEGCGYAGGIMSSAVDGLKCAKSAINLI